VAAYTATHNGASTDYFLADPELNARFVDECRKLGTPGEPIIWNQTLLRERKRGRLPKLASSGRRIRFREMDEYSFASEVALHLLSVEFGLTLDGILCDPEMASLFDDTAARFSPAKRTSREYRWAALALRKRAKHAKRLAHRYEQWLTSKLPAPEVLSELVPSDQETPGVYVLAGRDDRVLYVGETYDLGHRLAELRATPAWVELNPETVRLFPGHGRGLSGLKSVLIQRVNPRLNSLLLFPRLAPVDSGL
jgi:site-specific DNA-methyltransferase (adenine-specific)